MCSWSKSPRVGEIQILSDQKSFFLLYHSPDLLVFVTAKVFFYHCVRFMAEQCQAGGNLNRKVFVELDSHRI